ncbi:ABC transporter permease subunit [Bradyrhizobium ottawaense]|uniref:ABC transporter permease subunit n=1 Tax=Bradyrhizobium ottawaense TaxID=931866 RepID=UPI0035194A2D
MQLQAANAPAASAGVPTFWLRRHRCRKSQPPREGALFPVYINTVGGIRNADPKLIELGKSYGLGRSEVVLSIILPAALQPILVGMRYALGVAWLTLVVGETIASRDGVGYLVQNARELLRIDIIVLAIILYAIAGWLSDFITRLIERRLLRWHPNYADGVKA